MESHRGMKRSRDEALITPPQIHPAFESVHDPTSDNSSGHLSALNPLSGLPLSPHYFELLETRQALPVWANRELITTTIAANKVTLLVGETGSGKSTQLPQYLLAVAGAAADGSPGRVVCTQPRRVAAMSLANRVAEELDVELGAEVGYSVRFEERRTERTRVNFVTDGMLLREAMQDSMLRRYSVLIVDEAHERTVASDLLLGLVKQHLMQREDIRIVIMSATLDVAKFKAAFTAAPTIRVPGRMYPVSTYYTSTPVKDYVATAIDFAERVHREEPPGDILIFLIGEAEIEYACRTLRQRLGVSASAADSSSDGPLSSSSRPASVRPLYGALPMDDQRRVFDPPATPDERRIIVATNIAETSLTIDGVVYVIDSGYCKQHAYLPDTRVDCLTATVISQAAAQQRQGRAGRTRPGKCFRLFCEKDWALLPPQTHPEMQRSSMADVCLTLLRLGVENIVDFPFLDPPAPTTLAEALTHLHFLGAIDEDMNITDGGRRMSEFPLDPASARMLLESPRYGCSMEIAAIAAMVSAAANIFTRGSGGDRAAMDEARRLYAHPDGDHIQLLNIYMTFVARQKSPQFCRESCLSHRALAAADRVYYQLQDLMTRRGVPVVSCLPLGVADAWRYVDSTVIRRAVLAGFFANVGFQSTAAGRDGRYVMMREKVLARIHRSSGLSLLPGRPRWVVFNEFEMTSMEEGPSMKCVSPVEVGWLREVSPDYFDPAEMEDMEVAQALRAQPAVGAPKQ
jgi:pre-mRNA-splicing factor ATP-dependent RNA helicase DHX15/PRP43